MGNPVSVKRKELQDSMVDGVVVVVLLGTLKTRLEVAEGHAFEFQRLGYWTGMVVIALALPAACLMLVIAASRRSRHRFPDELRVCMAAVVAVVAGLLVLAGTTVVDYDDADLWQRAVVSLAGAGTVGVALLRCLNGGS